MHLASMKVVQIISSLVHAMKNHNLNIIHSWNCYNAQSMFNFVMQCYGPILGTFAHFLDQQFCKDLKDIATKPANKDRHIK